MKALLATLILLISLPRAIHAEVVLLVVADDTATNHAALIDEWRNQVISEGWKVITEVVPHTTWRDPQRAERALYILRRAEQIQPKALFLLGAVARPATGSAAPDGHAPRAIWNDFVYSGVKKSDLLSDALEFNVDTGLNFYKNSPNDSRWDTSYFTGPARWAVGRVDFSDMPLIARGTIPDGYYGAGEQRIPAVDENQALADYLIRDLKWRRGRWKIAPTGVIFSSLWDETNLALLRQNQPRINWTKTDKFTSNPWAGQEIYSYASFGQDYRYHFYLRSLDAMMKGVWFHNYRSYEYEPIWEGGNQQGDNGNRHWLLWFLFTTWGPKPPGELMKGPTIADGYLQYYGTIRIRYAHEQLDGDPTIPLQPSTQAAPMAPSSLRLVR